MAPRNPRIEVFMTRDGKGTDEQSWHRVEATDVGDGLLHTAEAVVEQLNAEPDGHTYELMDAHQISKR